MQLIVDRDSVCAGDDASSHDACIEVPADMPLEQLLSIALQACPLASIDGGQATWIMEVGAGAGPAQPVAVIAQQWQAPRWLCDPRQTVGALLASKRLAGLTPRVLFAYWAQAEPQAVVRALQRGETPPRR